MIRIIEHLYILKSVKGVLNIFVFYHLAYENRHDYLCTHQSLD